MTTKRVKLIAKREDQHRDDRSIIRPLFDDFMFFISLPRLFLLPAFFTIINNSWLNVNFKKVLSMPTFIIIILAII